MGTETIDSEVVTLEPRGPGPTPESVPIDIKMDPGTVGAGAATPLQEQSHRFDPQNGAGLKLFSLNLPALVPSRPPLPPKSQPRTDLSSLQQVDLTAKLLDVVGRLRSEVYTLKFAPPALPTPATWTQPARPRPASFRTT